MTFSLESLHFEMQFSLSKCITLLEQPQYQWGVQFLGPSGMWHFRFFCCLGFSPRMPSASLHAKCESVLKNVELLEFFDSCAHTGLRTHINSLPAFHGGFPREVLLVAFSLFLRIFGSTSSDTLRSPLWPRVGAEGAFLSCLKRFLSTTRP